MMQSLVQARLMYTRTDGEVVKKQQPLYSKVERPTAASATSGIAGCTPSTANQWHAKVVSRGHGGISIDRTASMGSSFQRRRLSNSALRTKHTEKITVFQHGMFA